MKTKRIKAWAIYDDGFVLDVLTTKKHTKNCKGGCSCDPVMWRYLIFQSREAARDNSTNGRVIPVTITYTVPKKTRHE